MAIYVRVKGNLKKKLKLPPVQVRFIDRGLVTKSGPLVKIGKFF